MEAVGMVGPPTQTLRQQSEEEPPCFHRKSKKQTKQSKCKKNTKQNKLTAKVLSNAK